MNVLSTTLLVGGGGFLGANARYWLGTWIQSKATIAFPWNTFFINVAGSIIIGLFLGLFARFGWHDNWRLFIAIGVLGGFTTFSSFSYEIYVFISEGNYLPAITYVVASVGLGIVGTWIGVAGAKAFTGS